MASQSANVTIDIGTKADTRGFKQVESALDKLSKSVKNVAGALGLAYGAKAIANFGKASVQAFAADDKAAKVLTRSLDNLGLSFANIQVKGFIADLEKTYAVLDDQLRPAFQRLLTTTGNIAKSQELLKQALDLSAASGIDLETVASDLAKAYTGQTRGLTKYGLGLSQTQLKAMKFEDVQKRINVLFGGDAKLVADSYAGSLQKLGIAANNAKEIIGKGLVDALGAAGGNGGLAGSLSGIIKLATVVSDLFVGIGRTIAAVKPFFTAANPVEAFKQYQQITAQFRLDDQIARRQYGGAAATKYQQEAAAAAKKTATTGYKATLAQTKAIKEQTALQKANALFDMQQIELVAALKGKLSDEDRKRAELQLAVLQENTSEASKLAAQVATAQGLTKELVAYYSGLKPATDPFLGWLTSLDAIQKKASEIVNLGSSVAQLGPLGGLAAGVIAGVNPTNIPSAALDTQGIYNGSSTATMSTLAQVGPLGGLSAGVIAGVNPTINITVQGSVTTQQDLVSAVRDGLLNNSLSGKQAALSRSQGTFGG